MDIGKCPNCGTFLGLEDLDNETFMALIVVQGAMLSTISMMAPLMHLEQYAMAKEGFEARINEITKATQQHTEELISWGEHFDGTDEDEA